ncbi:hypothetical protein K0M31_018381 [Melipona bicolor]|uniref:Uncharacterized protein n=1 Tax=Melipona bicolor TaxID=60889 RepID=A0AA40G3C6_9HYME|nr:hypothetical protein K0M31_018381 [Melipona bicolor]
MAKRSTSRLKKEALSRKKYHPKVLRLFLGCKDSLECRDVTTINEQFDEFSWKVVFVFGIRVNAQEDKASPGNQDRK